ncbi:B2 bradykinin receptor-like [Hyla sarda]|uniref:B2 bradykinin receptor-like n=1 Tax=Hyla sarda TaxID=327740 RepID=UPI0024C399E1|nr:B2 bradykinin receptor-like [Hyla sarda]XP_056401897.1 B2 bradykinin receptor-like [Hyla sarda]XP_056401898.1 B2 bradykinin receptor-like [Hyla sarda]
MMSTEPNGTMTTLADITETPKNECLYSILTWKIDEWVTTYQPPYMWFIFVLGFIENLFVISVFVLHKSRCTVTEIYLGNMAAADLIFLSGLPFMAIYISNKYHWSFGGFMCAAVTYVFRLDLYSSIYFLMMVSIDRYLALVKATSFSRLRRPWWAKVNCGIIWMFATVLSLPYGVFRKVVFKEELNTTACFLEAPKTWFIVLNIITNILGFLVPLVVTAFCTFKIICFLKNNSMQQFKKAKKERKATRLVLFVFLLFIVCWLPFNIYTFLDLLPRFNVHFPCMVSSIYRMVYHISLFLALANSCINPIMYSMIGNRFRQKTREVYRRLLCKGPDRGMSSFRTEESVKSTQISLSIRSYNKSIA